MGETKRTRIGGGGSVIEQRTSRRLSRRQFLAGAAVGAGALGAAALGAAAWLEDPDRPPDLYEYYVDSYWFDSSGLRDEPLRSPLRGATKAKRLPAIEHGFTHFRLRAQPWLCTPSSLEERAGRLWVDLADAAGAAVPAPVRTLLRTLGGVRPD